MLSAPYLIEYAEEIDGCYRLDPSVPIFGGGREEQSLWGQSIPVGSRSLSSPVLLKTYQVISLKYIVSHPQNDSFQLRRRFWA